MDKIKSWLKWIKRREMLTLFLEVILDWKTFVALPLTWMVFLQWLDGDTFKEYFNKLENAKIFLDYILSIEPFYLLGIMFFLMLVTCINVAKRRDDKIKELQSQLDRRKAKSELSPKVNEWVRHFPHQYPDKYGPYIKQLVKMLEDSGAVNEEVINDFRDDNPFNFNLSNSAILQTKLSKLKEDLRY